KLAANRIPGFQHVLASGFTIKQKGHNLALNGVLHQFHQLTVKLLHAKPTIHKTVEPFQKLLFMLIKIDDGLETQGLHRIGKNLKNPRKQDQVLLTEFFALKGWIGQNENPAATLDKAE